jgi:flagellar biosynthesis/type III secretory pathway protein FliH
MAPEVRVEPDDSDMIDTRLNVIVTDLLTSFNVLVAKNNPRKIRIKMLRKDLDDLVKQVRVDLNHLARNQFDIEKESMCDDCDRGHCDDCERGHCDDCNRGDCDSCESRDEGYSDGHEAGLSEGREEAETSYQPRINELENQVRELLSKIEELS